MHDRYPTEDDCPCVDCPGDSGDLADLLNIILGAATAENSDVDTGESESEGEDVPDGPVYVIPAQSLSEDCQGTETPLEGPIPNLWCYESTYEPTGSDQIDEPEGSGPTYDLPSFYLLGPDDDTSPRFLCALCNVPLTMQELDENGIVSTVQHLGICYPCITGQTMEELWME